MPIRQRDIGDLQQLLDNSPYDELEVESDGQRLVLKRGADGGWTYDLATLAEPSLIAGSLKVEEEKEAAASQDARAAAEGLITIHAPLPGTYYRAPKPGADPFVQVGSQVGEHTVIGIIETMKLMNSVPAGVKGDIVEIVVGNGTFVETGHVLMHVRPAEGKA